MKCHFLFKLQKRQRLLFSPLDSMTEYHGHTLKKVEKQSGLPYLEHYMT